jgi:sugar/nucleoside kinase (ribokinase family)
MEYDVVGMGHALMDIIVDVDYEFLNKLGFEKGSMVLINDEQHHRLIEQLKDKKLLKATGGSASNTSKGVSILGGKSAFMGLVGRDDNGKTYEKLLMDSGIKAALKYSEKNTGTSIVCITPDRERTMLTYLGAASEFKEKDVDEDIVKNSKILHIEGYFVGNPGTYTAVLKAMKIAKNHNRMISMDLSDTGLIKAKIDTFKELLKEYVDIVFVNEHEAKAFTDKEEEDAVHILSEYCDVSIVKLGAKGSIIKHHDKINNIKTLHKIPIHKVEVINTNGAGDAYASGILYSIAHNVLMEKAGKIASYISSRVVSIPEATLNHSIEHEVKRIIEE